MSTLRTLPIAAVPPLALALCALALAGCGRRPAPAGAGSPASAAATSAAATSTAAASATTAASPPSAAASSACPASALKVSLNTAAAGVAGGSSLVPLEFENVSASSCTLPEYPDVSFAAGSAGPDIGAPAARQHAAQASALVLAPGTVAHAWLQISDVANYPASSCKPVTAHGLRVSFASATAGTFVAKALQACCPDAAGQQHRPGRVPGPGRPGQARHRALTGPGPA